MPSISFNFCWSYAPFEVQTLTNMQFSALFYYMLWHIELKFCIWLCLTVLKIKFECHQFASIFVGVMSLLELRILEIHSFQNFSLPFFDSFELKFYIWLCFTVLQIKLEFCQFASIFVEVMPLWDIEYLKYTVFHTFLLLAFTYWAEIFHMTIDQVRVSSLSVHLALHPSIHFLHFPPTCMHWQI